MERVQVKEVKGLGVLRELAELVGKVWEVRGRAELGLCKISVTRAAHRLEHKAGCQVAACSTQA